MNYELLMPQPDNLIKKELSAIEWVFANRGILPEDIHHYLNTTEQDIINPRFLNNM